MYERRGVEQLVARRAHNPEVGGSSPPPATNKPLISKEIGGFSFCTTLSFVRISLAPPRSDIGMLASFGAQPQSHLRNKTNMPRQERLPDGALLFENLEPLYSPLRSTIKRAHFVYVLLLIVRQSMARSKCASMSQG